MWDIVGDRKGAERIFLEKPEKRDYLEDRGIDGLIILKSIFKKWSWDS
jgi:hypothetical protein